MEKQIILFDIDKTLFDVNAFFSKNVWPAVEKDLKISKSKLDKVSEIYQKTLTKNTEFDPKGWMSVARKELGDMANDIKDYIYNPDFFVDSIFNEVIPALNELKEDFILGIYSEGIEEWQRKKMELSGLNNYFEQKYIIISPDKVSQQVLETIPKGVIVVDDRSDIILDLQTVDGIYPVWLNRTEKQSLPNTKEIKNLTGLLPMMERIRLENPL
jgi:phosphoglycolate phosphatase-like HAD superfamily hydrolase